MNKKFFNIKIFLLSIFFIFLCPIYLASAELLKKEKILDIAKRVVIKLEYDWESMEREAAFFSTPYNPYLPDDSEATDDHEKQILKTVRDKLRNKKYWVVYFFPISKKILDGDIAVFIHAADGKLLYIRSLDVDVEKFIEKFNKLK